ncbi:MAG: glycosyltransferase [Legionellaceae bacterium]|nr:glycosyltransferase [Legionellaceae bacterium]
MSVSLKKLKIARVSTIPFFIFTQLRTQIQRISECGAEVTIVTSPPVSGEENIVFSIDGCQQYAVGIAREIRPVADMLAIIRLWRLFRRQRFTIVHSTTPKAGLLCAIAGKLAGVPVRLHTFTGQPWVTMTGLKGHIVRWCDTLMIRMNTRCYADSPSQKDFLIAQGLAKAEQLSVIGSGSLAGVDTQRFSPSRFSAAEREALRAKYGIAPDCQIVLFLGRITHDKGIFELCQAAARLLQQAENMVLLIVGPFEASNEKEMRDYARRYCGDRVIFAGFHPEPERFIAISDLLCLPSYREGFGTVVIEAAAMAVPTVASRIYGLTDAVVDGKTGLLVEPANVAALAAALQQMLLNPDRMRQMGQHARKRALAEFDSQRVNDLVIAEYERLVTAKVSPLLERQQP